jgi:hypothetical protein
MKSYSAILGICLAGALSASAQPVWDSVDNVYYQAIPDPTLADYPTSPAGATGSWTQAYDDSLALPTYLGLYAHLAVILNQNEETAVTTAITDAGFGGEAWVGARQVPITEPDQYAGWTWINGVTFPGYVGQPGSFGSLYTDWSGGEPNDAGGPGFEQYLGVGLEGPGTWNDEGNPSYGPIDGYVVEYDANQYQPISTPDGGATVGLLGGAMIGLATLRRKLAA